MPPSDMPSTKELIKLKDNRGDTLFISRFDRPTGTAAYLAVMHVQLPERTAALLGTPDIRSSVFLDQADLRAIMRMIAAELGQLDRPV